MSKLTPPAPQNARRRTKFMLDNPKHPKAKAWLDYMTKKLGGEAASAWFRRKDSDKRPWDQFVKDFISDFTKGVKNVKSA